VGQPLLSVAGSASYGAALGLYD